MVSFGPSVLLHCNCVTIHMDYFELSQLDILIIHQQIALRNIGDGYVEMWYLYLKILLHPFVAILNDLSYRLCRA